MNKKTIFLIIVALAVLIGIRHIIRQRKIDNLILRLTKAQELEQYKSLEDTARSSNYEIVPLNAKCINGFIKIRYDRQNKQYIIFADPINKGTENEQPNSSVYRIDINGYTIDTISPSQYSFFDNGLIEISDSTRSNWISTGDRTNIIPVKRENINGTLSKEEFSNRFMELYNKCESTTMDYDYKNRRIYCFYFPNEIIQLYEEKDTQEYSYETNFFNNNNIEEKTNTRFVDIETEIVTNISTDYFYYDKRLGMTLTFNPAYTSYPDPTFRGTSYITLRQNNEPIKVKIPDALYEIDTVFPYLSFGYPPYEIIKESNIIFIKHFDRLYILRKMVK